MLKLIYILSALKLWNILFEHLAFPQNHFKYYLAYSTVTSLILNFFRLKNIIPESVWFFPKCLLLICKNSSCCCVLPCLNNLTVPKSLKNIPTTKNSWNRKSTKSLLWLVIVKLNVSWGNSNLIQEITQIIQTGITIARKIVIIMNFYSQLCV